MDDTKRLPIYLVVDASGGMHGEKIESVRQGIRSLLADLRGDPRAMATVWLSVITFGSSARQNSPLSSLGLFREPDLDADGAVAMGEALGLLKECIEREARENSTNRVGDWKPFVFLMSFRQPQDSWETAAEALMSFRPMNIIACAIGPYADEMPLKRITPFVVRMEEVQPDAFKSFFAWVSASIRAMTAGVNARGGAAVSIPQPPSGISIVS
ncbi:hypothetical protein NNJEOMEG_04012 [Fundidesulfovibrio magnetotacticus]|uniref:VWFA domain-containing protein n=2 Tax=Fundidesulfovibrio magnetotacticus TaxID=2730080 RepID=A0A6V8LUJ3_9BACT|nr:hypothetical protein NNJEOMEG_04012 [Fundidesulfovibrio magnetotacticus]